MSMHLSVIDSLTRVDSTAWNALVDDGSPFLKHEFLSSLETSGCVGAGTGWQPQHLVIHADGPLRGTLLGAVPLYLKDHSYGEYIFDWAWANAYVRTGLDYYPKLVAAVPFTPVTGTRLLAAHAQNRDKIRTELIKGALDLAARRRVSSLHWLFTQENDTRLLERRGHLRRCGYQFHWRNQGYRSFEEFLNTFSSEKRKKLRRERRFVREAGITMEAVPGEKITVAQWRMFYEFYLATVRNHAAFSYLNKNFFEEIGRRMPENIVLILARRNGEIIAGALNLQGGGCLYGRYWGSLKEVPNLHFETCYYSAIEYCIAHAIKRFEAGAQGEHKIARGLLPVPTYSAHWLSHPEFSRAIEEYLTRERSSVEYYMNELDALSPYKKTL